MGVDQDYKKASENYLLYIKLKDSISVTEKERQLVNEEVAFNVEQKETEILEKNKTLEQNRLNNAKQKIKHRALWFWSSRQGSV